jgi:cyanophycinase
LAVLLLLMGLPAGGASFATQMLVPIGGGYSEETLQGFARVVLEHATGDQARIIVLPISYGDDPAIREENIEQALVRTGEVEAACDAVVAGYGYSDCTAELVLFFDENDAENPAVVAAIENPEVDGAFILGGDQTIAMRITASSPAEAAMEDAYARGVVFGGTSAGAAVESLTMLAGYTASGWPYNAFERNQIDIWWANDGDDLRGLTFGSDEIVFDQHFYERGRMTRLYNVVAQSDEQFGGASRLGVGVDYATGILLGGGAVLAGVVGDSSATIIDGESLGATFAWVGANQTLSARNVLTHVMAQHDTVSYDVPARDIVVDGAPLAPDFPTGWQAGLLAAPGSATLILGGDIAMDFGGPAATAFVDAVAAGGSTGPVWVIAGGTAKPSQARKLASGYARGLGDAGLDALGIDVETIAIGTKQWERFAVSELAGASGVVFTGGDQALLAGMLADATFQSALAAALANAPVIMADGALTAAMGDWYVTDPDPTADNYQEAGIADFQTGNVTIAQGLGILPGAAFEPLVTYDQRWGRLYSLTMAHPETIAFGISELTALVLGPDGATVAGERSVVALDGRAATYLAGDNGAFSAFNVVSDVFAPGDAVSAE